MIAAFRRILLTENVTPEPQFDQPARSVPWDTCTLQTTHERVARSANFKAATGCGSLAFPRFRDFPALQIRVFPDIAVGF